MNAGRKTLVIDHQTGTYILTTRNGERRRAPINHPETVEHVAGFYKWLGYRIQIIERELPMVTQRDIERNHVRALRAVKAGETKINHITLRAMVNRGLITDDLEITPAGERFYSNYQGAAEDSELEPGTVVSAQFVEMESDEPVTDDLPADEPTIETAPVISESSVTVQPEQPATDEARDTILALRKVALDLGKALVEERVPELNDLFNAIARSDEYLFK